MIGLSFIQGSAGLRGFYAASDRMQTAMERLATGKRINRASDDPAGLVGVTNMKSDQIVLEKKIQGFEVKTHWMAAREGALSALNAPLAELAGLVTSAGNRDALDEGELEAIQIEVNGILDGIDHVLSTATFKGEFLFAGMSSKSLGLSGLRSGGEFNLADGDLEGSQKVAEGAADSNVRKQAVIGAEMKQIASLSRAMQAELEAITGEISRVEDADMAKEVSELVRNQVMQEVSMAMEVVGRQSAATVLQLLDATIKGPAIK